MNSLLARVTGKLTLQTVLIIPFVLQIGGIVGLVGYLSYRNNQKAVNEVASQLHQQISDRIQQYLQVYPATPHLINWINRDAVHLGQLNLADRSAIKRYLLYQLLQFNSISAIELSNQQGNLIRAERYYGQLTILESDQSEPSQFYRYQVESNKINTHNRTTIVICLAALAGATAIGIFTTGWITQAISRLNIAIKNIAQRKWQKKEQALPESQRRYQTLVEASPVCIFHTDAVGNFIYVNQRWSEITGISLELARESNWTSSLHPEDRDRVFSEWYQAAGAKRPFKSEYRCLRPDGKITWVLVQALPEIGDDGEIIGYIGTITDISDVYRLRQFTEQKLKQNEAQLETIITHTSDGIMIIDRQGCIRFANPAATQLFNKPLPELIGYEWGIPLGDTSEVALFDAKQRKIRLAEMKATVTQWQGELAYVVSLRDISDRKQFEQALQASQARFSGILEIANDAIISVDAQQRITLFNQGAEKIFGYTTAEVLGQPLDLLLPLGVREIHHQHINNYTRSGSKARPMAGRSEIFGRRKDGTEFPAEASISTLEINGETVCTAILRDITDAYRQAMQRKQAEVKLRTSEQMYRTIAKNFPKGAIFLFDHNLRYLVADGQALTEPEVNHHRESLEGKTLWEVLPAETCAIIEPIYRDALAGGEQTYELIVHNRTYSYQTVSLKNETGQIIAGMVVTQDITESKQFEQALRESQERFQEIARTISQCFFVRSAISGQFLYISPAYEKIWGRSCESLYQNPQSWIASVYPEDRELILNSPREQLSGNFVQREYRIMKPDGSIRWITAAISVVLDDTGEPLRFIGIAEDISDRKIAEEALRRYERIVSATADGISLVDRNYIYQLVNQTYITWHHKTYSSIVGHSVSDLLGSEQFANLVKDYLDRSLNGEIIHCQSWFELALGRRFLSVTYSPYLEADQTISGVVVSLRDITELKQIEEQLRQINQEMEAIFAAFPDLLFRLAADGTIVDFKTKNNDNLYTSPATFMGKRVQDILPPPVGQKIHAAVRQVLETNSPINLEYSLPLPEGEQYFEARMVNFQENEVIAVTRNISDRKLAELQLQDREYRLRTLADNLPNGLIYQLIQEPNGKTYFSYITAGIEHLVGIKPELILQDPTVLHNLIIEEDRLLNEQLTAESRQNLSIFEMQMRKRKSTGEIQWSYVRSAPRRLDDGRTIWDGIEIDITNLKKAETELAQAKEAAEAANRAKSQFLANMSHELRTPLNGILGYAQILQAEPDIAPKQKEGINIIYQCGIHLLTLINDILDLSKIEAGKLELYPADFNFSSFLHNISQLFRFKAEQKEINFTYTTINQLPTFIHADEKRLRQVLMNLLSNAVKFTDTGTVTFKVGYSLAKNTPQPTTDNRQQTISKIRFEIKDTGIGIATEQLEKIFLPFEQVADSSRQGEGTGLGLSISQKIVSLMGSKILVDSTVGVGSKFWFEIEVPIPLNWVEATPISFTSNIIGYEGQKRKILIVDDRWENCSIISNLLEPIGFEVQCAYDGQQGLEKALNFQPDLIISDLLMPQMDGLEMARQIRQLTEFQTTILIATSASVFATEQQKSLDCGYNGFLPKPIQAKEILQILKNYFDLTWIEHNSAQIFGIADEDNTKLKPQEPAPEMIIPPSEELIPLYEAAQIGHVEKVQQEIFRLQELSPDYINFAIKILEFAHNFDYEKLVVFLEQQAIRKE